METIITLFTTIFFLVLPCIAIFSFTSSITRGIYNWAERQNNMDITFTPDFGGDKRRKLTPEEENEMYLEYYGHPAELEDSDEMSQRLDEIEFDFRNYMRTENAKRTR